MTLKCRPIGRGNWNIWTIKIDRSDMHAVKVGDVIHLGAWRLRVVEIVL